MKFRSKTRGEVHNVADAINENRPKSLQKESNTHRENLRHSMPAFADSVPSPKPLMSFRDAVGIPKSETNSPDPT